MKIKDTTGNRIIASLIYIGCTLGCYFMSSIKSHLDNAKNIS